MIGNVSTAIRRFALPTLAEIEHRRAELLGYLSDHPHAADPPTSAEPPSFPENNSPPMPQELSTLPPPRPPAELRLGEAALYGLAGSAVRTMAPYTEAHTAAILLQLLAAFGNVVGPGPHCMVGATRHALHHRLVRHGSRMRGADGRRGRGTPRILGGADLARLPRLPRTFLSFPEPGFPATQRRREPRMRLSAKKGA